MSAGKKKAAYSGVPRARAWYRPNNDTKIAITVATYLPVLRRSSYKTKSLSNIVHKIFKKKKIKIADYKKIKQRLRLLSRKIIWNMSIFMHNFKKIAKK